MKKVLFALAVALCLPLLSGCGSDEPEASHYSEKQQKVFAMFSGTWADYQFSNLGGYLPELHPDPDKIVFGSHYSAPKEIKKTSYIDGEAVVFDAQGECVYSSVAYKGQPYESTKCYYNVSPSATILSLWDVENNRMFEVYDLKVISETEFYLYDSGITLPYIFKRQ